MGSDGGDKCDIGCIKYIISTDGRGSQNRRLKAGWNEKVGGDVGGG